MATQEERLSVVEQTVASLRNDFLQAIVENTHSISTLNRVVTQQEQNVRDANHEITILLGVVSSQGKDIKEVKSGLAALDERMKNLETTLSEHTTRFDRVETLLSQILTRLPEKP